MNLNSIKAHNKIEVMIELSRHLLFLMILAIETSCDESAVAIVEQGTKVHSNVIASQIDIHSLTGGVVPEVASREHMKAILPTLREAFKEAKLDWNDITHIAVTKEPGLIGSVLVGRMSAAAFAFAMDKTLIEVNHIHGHIYSNWLDIKDSPQFPILSLTVSGGHNELIWMPKDGVIESLGRSMDDAAGEAFDKTARLLGLGYPGGPAIEKAAQKGNHLAVKFPIPKLEEYNFSFSGLKTAVLYYLQSKQNLLQDKDFIADVAASFQYAVIESLIYQLMKAVKEKKPKEVHLAGGVSANKALRSRIQIELNELSYPPLFRFPVKMSYCTDNAAMIGAAGFQKLKHKLV